MKKTLLTLALGMTLNAQAQYHGYHEQPMVEFDQKSLTSVEILEAIEIQPGTKSTQISGFDRTNDKCLLVHDELEETQIIETGQEFAVTANWVSVDMSISYGYTGAATMRIDGPEYVKLITCDIAVAWGDPLTKENVEHQLDGVIQIN